MKLNCKYCNNEFEVPDCWAKRGRKYCSKECYDNNQTQFKPKPCKECGRVFKPVNGQVIFCNLKCWYKWNKNNSRINRICKQCNKEFKVLKHYLNNGRGIFCSKDCKNEYQRNKFKKIASFNFRKRVFNFFPKVCVFCGSKDNLEAHHIIPQEYNKRHPTGKGNHRVRNGCILCNKCHKGLHSNLKT